MWVFLTAAAGVLLPREAVGPPSRLSQPVVGRRGALELDRPVVGRRGALEFAAAALIALGVPAQASASYAMQNAAQVSYDQRKASGFKPVATSDRETLAAIQDKIDDKRRFRPDENDLGIIDTYTKKSAQERLEYDRAQEEEKSRKKNEYQSIPGVEL